MPTLSICLIVRNEAAHLERCLTSVQGLWDDLVVLDTGSEDATAAIAARFGARVLSLTWRGDFSAARNACKAEARGEWILSLDADETIAARDHAVIRQLIARRDINAALARQRHYVTDTVLGWQAGPGGYEEGTPYPGFLDVECRRLFRNVPWLRWHERVHEEVRSTDAAHPVVEVHGGFVIHHFGKVGSREVLRAKTEAYVDLARRKIEDDATNPQAHYELGLTWAELRRHDHALPCFEQALALAPGFRDARFRLAVCHARLGHDEAALRELEMARRELPAHAAVIALEEGNVQQQRGDLHAAASAFIEALRLSPDLAAASINLSLVHAARGDTTAARAALDDAVSRAPANADLRLRRAHLLRAQGDLNAAIADVEAARTHPEARPLLVRLLAQQRRFDAAAALLDAPGHADHPDLPVLRGIVALGRGRVDDAVRHLRDAWDGRPTGEAALNLSIALEAAGSGRAALVAAAHAADAAGRRGPAVERVRRLLGSHPLTTAPDGDDGRLWFFHHPRSIPYDGDTPRTRGLGGTESAVVYLAEALVRRGHRAVVFNQRDETTACRGVTYMPASRFVTAAVDAAPTVVVHIRDWAVAGRLRLAPLQLFWTGDAFDQPFLQAMGDAEAREAIDFVMLQSAWQERTFSEYHRLPTHRILRTRLGSAASADPVPARPSSAPRPPRLAYTSTPFRGLDVLLDLFPAIRAACPAAELDVFSSLAVYGVDAEDDQRRFGTLYERARQPGITWHGSVAQPMLAGRLQETRILAYPNTFPETFCIAAIEAQAAGAVVVTSTLGALPETVGQGGVCVPGTPGSRSFGEAFVAECVALLTDDDRWQTLQVQALTRAWTDYTWDAVAADWERMAAAATSHEPAVVQRIAVHLKAGRVALAQRMANGEQVPSGLPDGAWAAVRQYADWRAGLAPEPPSPEAQRLMCLWCPSLRAA